MTNDQKQKIRDALVDLIDACEPYISDRLFKSTKEALAILDQIEVRDENVMPKCYKSNPSYQAQAENDCATCDHQNRCLKPQTTEKE